MHLAGEQKLLDISQFPMLKGISDNDGALPTNKLQYVRALQEQDGLDDARAEPYAK